MTTNLDATSVFGVEGKIALVTGGGSGIGLMMARGLADNGAKVYVGGRRKDVVEKAAASYGKNAKGSIVALELDVTKKESILAAVQLIESAEGKLDILINNAGQVGPKSPFLTTPGAPELATAATLGSALFQQSFEDWSQIFTINTSSIYFVSTAFLDLLARGSAADEPFSASIVNITSISGNMKLAQDHFGYNASKAAGDHLTKMLATELALKNVKVRVNSIAPGLFPTEMTGKEGAQFDTAEEVTSYSGAIHTVPGGRSGRAEEIAGPALFLVSKAGRYVNGQVLIVDGSWLAVNPSTH